MSIATRLPAGFEVFARFEDFCARRESLELAWHAQQALGDSLAIGDRFLRGYCYWCKADRRFKFNRTHHDTAPNWRESLKCEGCGLINRWRASLHLFDLLFEGATTDPIYLTEQVSPLYRALRKRFPSAIGSEFIDPLRQGGAKVLWRFRMVRHEDATRLSFADASQTAVLSFDVLEHVADFRAVLGEFARVLRPGALLLLTAPFLRDAAHTLVRARQRADGSIEHVLPPVYHGDPLARSGVLCFQEFGWDLLDHLRDAGFARAEIVTAWDPELGYLGSFQSFIVAWR